MCEKMFVRLLVAAALLASAVSAQADVLNMPAGQTSLKFVTVGDPGNPPDPATGSQYGSVGYTYQMGEFDVTVGQYCQFLNAVAKTSDPYGLYYSGMATDLPTIAITQSGSSGNYSYAVTGGYNGTYSQAANCPVFDVTWGDAARFCNWLDNGQPTAPEGNGTTETGAYTLNGDVSNLTTETRNPGAKYFIPTENEWYKCAFYNPANGSYWTFPTQSNTAPSNSLILAPTSTNDANFDSWNGRSYVYIDPTNYLTPVGEFEDTTSPFGAYDMGGDVWQWNEATFSGSSRGVRGGSWRDSSGFMASSSRTIGEPTEEFDGFGFRVASVPEPGSIALLLAGALAFGIWKYRRA
jgi:formylglycine-generating enzyme required for sulfatase activity